MQLPIFYGGLSPAVSGHNLFYISGNKVAVTHILCLYLHDMISKKGVDLSVCAYCKTTLDEYSRTVDHLFPKSRGGKLSNSNKVPSCGDCNKMKGSMNITEFSRALNGLIYYEHVKHKEHTSHLKKIKLNVEKLINDRRKK